MRFRNARPQDIDDCLALLELHGGFRADPSVQACLGQPWLDHMENEAFASFQVFEIRSGDGWKIVAFRNALFVTDAFRQEYAAAPFAQIGAEIWRRVLNDASPILSYDEIAIANGKSELNMVIPHTTMRDRDRGNPETAEALVLILKARHHAHSGYKLRNLTAMELFGDSIAVVPRDLGYHQYELVDADGQTLKDNPSESNVFWWDHKGDTVGSGSAVSLIAFATPRPRFGFSRAQQRLLRWALDDMSDREIAQTLDIRHDTIRRRWESIYQTVREIDQSILPATNKKTGRRGAAHRHLLLEYLRQHLEEIRPYKEPPAT